MPVGGATKYGQLVTLSGSIYVSLCHKGTSVSTFSMKIPQVEEQIAEIRRGQSQAFEQATKELRDAKEAARSELDAVQTLLRQVKLPIIIDDGPGQDYHQAKNVCEEQALQ